MKKRTSAQSSAALLTPREAAAAIGVSYPAIKQWILAGKLRTVKTPGGHHRIPRAALRRYLPMEPVTPSAASRERFRTVSGRNQLIGTIVEVKISGLLAKVVLEIACAPRAQRVTSIITADAVREMQLRKGQTAAALMKSTEVMITRCERRYRFAGRAAGLLAFTNVAALGPGAPVVRR